MSTKLEECARALADLEGAKWNAASFNETMAGNSPRAQREGYISQVRAVIRCLMEPSEEMLDAGDLHVATLQQWRAMLQSVLDEEGK